MEVNVELGKEGKPPMEGENLLRENQNGADKETVPTSNGATEEDKAFVQRVTSYPVVASTIGKVVEAYTYCKESNEYVKYSLDTAESGVKYVSDTVAPVVHKLDRPLASVNSLACSGLDVVEQKCPIITKPTDEVVAETKNVYDSKIKPAVDKVASAGHYATEKIYDAKDYGVNAVSGVTNYGSEKIGMVRDTSYETVAMVRDTSIEKLNMVKDKSLETVHAALATETGQKVLGKIDDALVAAEGYVDYYLPEKTDEEKSDQPEEEKKMEVDEAEAKSRPLVVTDKVKNRLFTRAMNKLHDVRVRSMETLQRLNFTVDLIDYAKANLSSANERVHSSVQAAREKGQYWWDEVNKEEDEEEKEKGALEERTMEKQALQVARNLTKKLRHGLHSLNEKSIPEHLKGQVQAAKEYSSALMTSFYNASRIEDLSDTVMTRAHEQAEYIQETMTKLADLAVDKWPLNQVVPDFSIDEFSDDEEYHNGSHGSQTPIEEQPKHVEPMEDEDPMH